MGYTRDNGLRDSPKAGHNRNNRAIETIQGYHTFRPIHCNPTPTAKMTSIKFFNNLEYGYEYSSVIDDILDDPETHCVKSIEIDYRKEPFTANADELFLIEIVCHDGSVRLGRYVGTSYDVIDRLEETDTLQSWCQEWVANAGVENSPAFVEAVASRRDVEI
jgi:hypothetical protein